MKEKMKFFKREIKTWNKEVFGDIHIRKTNNNKDDKKLDLEDENNELNEGKKKEKRELLAKLQKVMFNQEALEK